MPELRWLCPECGEVVSVEFALGAELPKRGICESCEKTSEAPKAKVPSELIAEKHG